MPIDSTVTPSSRTRTLRPDPLAAAGAVVGLGCSLVGQYVGTPWDATAGGWRVEFDDGGGWAALAVLVGLVAVGFVAVSAFTARARAVPSGAAARRALGLAVLGVVSLLAFWSGLPAVLAGGALGLGLDARRRSFGNPWPAVVAVVLAVLTVLAAVWLAVTG